MAQNRVRNVPTFRAPSAYEEEMLRAQRQQQLAEMLRQQAFEPEAEPYTFQGFRATPTPANAIARVLSAYTAKKVGEKAEASERAAREADIAGAEEVLRGFGPQTRSVTGGALPETDVTGVASAYQPEMAQQPMMETVMPTAQERRDLLTQTMVRGTPMARQLAQFLAAQEPKTTTTEFGGQLLNVTGDTATPITMGGKPVTATKAADSLIGKPSPGDFTPASLAQFARTGNFADLVAVPKPAPVTNIDLGPKDTFKLEADLRGEVKDKLKNYEAVRDSYQKIENALSTGAGDIAVVYAFAKLNDPTSVVRESEFETVAKSGSLGQRIKNLVEQAQTGKMNPELRENLRQQARQMYLSQQTNAENIVNQYRELAQTYNLDPRKVLAGINVSNLIWSEDDEKELQRLRDKAAGRR